MRQSTGLVANLFQLAGLASPVPDLSTLCRGHKALTVHSPFRAPALFICSTGAKAEGEWPARKYGASKPRDWREVHLGIGAETLDIRAIEVTGSRGGDALLLPHLQNRIPNDAPFGSVARDDGHESRACHAAIAARAAEAITSPRKAMEGIAATSGHCGTDGYGGLGQRGRPWSGDNELSDRVSCETVSCDTVEVETRGFLPNQHLAGRFGSGGWDRTNDQLINSQLLYR